VRQAGAPRGVRGGAGICLKRRPQSVANKQTKKKAGLPYLPGRHYRLESMKM
jgi:hypothetical protein